MAPFRAAYKLEKEREENDAHCRALFLEVNFMMLLLVELDCLIHAFSHTYITMAALRR